MDAAPIDGRPRAGRAKYARVVGAHRPVCGGRYLVAHVGCLNFLPWTVLLLAVPFVAWWLVVAVHSSTAIGAGGAMLLCSAGAFLLATHLTEPGILPTTVRVPEPEAQTTAGRNVLIMTPCGGTNYRTVFGDRSDTGVEGRGQGQLAQLPCWARNPRAWAPCGEVHKFRGVREFCAPVHVTPGARAEHLVIVDRGAALPLGEFRAKMCTETGNAVEQFDHYCPWVGNAVGRRNYRNFVMFVFSTTVLAAYVCITAGLLLVATSTRDGLTVWSAALRYLGISAYIVYSLLFTIALVCLSMYHASLVCSATTTNERIKGRATARHREGVGQNCVAFFCSRLPPSHVAHGGGNAVTIAMHEQA